jgi:nucleoside-triphosphatase THEP1
MNKRLICITGEKDGGKTHLLYAVCSIIDLEGFSIGGMIQVPSLPNAEKMVYQLSDQHSGEIRTILDREKHDLWEPFKSFYLNQESFDWANNQILSTYQDSDFLIFDEIGLLELEKKGFYDSFSKVLHTYKGRIIFNVRDKFLTQICKEFRIDDDELLIIKSTMSSDSAYERIMND